MFNFFYRSMFIYFIGDKVRGFLHSCGVRLQYMAAGHNCLGGHCKAVGLLPKVNYLNCNTNNKNNNNNHYDIIMFNPVAYTLLFFRSR